MTFKHACIFLALVAMSALLLSTITEVRADESSNGEFMPTTLYMAGTGDDLKLWMPGPDEDALGESKQATTNDVATEGYVDVGRWYSTALDKDLHVEGQVTIHLFLNSTTDTGADVRLRITMFGETHVTEYYSTNTGILPVSINFDVAGWDGIMDEQIELYIEADARESPPPNNDKTIILNYWHMDRPGRIEFVSDSTDLAMDVNPKKDNEGVSYYEIFVNITDAFENKHIDVKSFVLNITSEDDPENYTAEARSDGSENPEYLRYLGQEYWDSWGYTSTKWEWYYEGRDYANDIEGQGVEPGDFLMHFEMNDTDGNQRYYDHLETGVNPLFVHVNIHTTNEYITIVDMGVNEKNVEEVAAHDEVRVRLWVEINRGREGYTYEFYVEFRDNGVLVDEGKKFVQMKGYTGKKVFFDWDPTEGDHNLTIDVDSDPEIYIEELDESDNDVYHVVNVIPQAGPTVVISSPTPGEYINSDVYIAFDASQTTNPISGGMTFKWTVFRHDGDDYVEKTTLSGMTVTATKLYERSYGAGDYKVVLEVTNDKRTATGEVMFVINTIPEIILVSPSDGEIFSTSDEILFDASESEDADGDELYFRWFSNIGGVLNKEKEGTSVEYSWDAFPKTLRGGEHAIILEVSDYDPTDSSDEGPKGIAYEYFNITVNTPPRAEIASPANNSKQSANSPILFDGSRSEDKDDPDAVLYFTWTDGNEWISGEPVFEDTMRAGPHKITLEVSDGLASSFAVVYITVGEPPIAKTSESKTGELKNGKAKVKLDASDSTPADDTQPIVRYLWDRDADVDSDGDNITDNDIDYDQSGPVVELEYTQKGTFTAMLWVEDDAGVRSLPFSITITIEEKDEDDFPIALVGAAIAVVAGAIVGIFFYTQRRGYDDEDEDDEEYEDAEEYEEEGDEAEYY